VVKNCKAKGSLLERNFKAYFEKFGYHVTKAGGSFGIDLVAIKKDCPPLFINVKWRYNYCGPAERQQLEKDAIKYGAIPVIAYKHIPKGKKNGRHCVWLYNCGNIDITQEIYTLLLPSLDKCSEGVLERLLGLHP
jgi:Holliday junction resolvase